MLLNLTLADGRFLVVNSDHVDSTVETTADLRAGNRGFETIVKVSGDTFLVRETLAQIWAQLAGSSVEKAWVTLTDRDGHAVHLNPALVGGVMNRAETRLPDGRGAEIVHPRMTEVILQGRSGYAETVQVKETVSMVVGLLRERGVKTNKA